MTEGYTFALPCMAIVAEPSATVPVVASRFRCGGGRWQIVGVIPGRALVSHFPLAFVAAFGVDAHLTSTAWQLMTALSALVHISKQQQDIIIIISSSSS